MYYVSIKNYITHITYYIFHRTYIYDAAETNEIPEDV